MTVEVRFTRRLGNNLFQYCMGRIVAESLGYELACVWAGPPPSAGFHERTSGEWATLPSLSHHFPNAPMHISGRRIEAPHERYVLGERNWSGQGIPLRAILNNQAERRLVFQGFFQRIEYYLPYHRQIRSWLAPSRTQRVTQPGAKDVVINIRRGLDYFVDGWVLAADYYIRALELLGPARVFVCGVGIDQTIRSALARFNPTYFKGSPIEEYCFLSSFRRIILSNSTFAWWAAWLSDADQIVFPRCSCYWGDEFPDVDLEVAEDRYIYIEDVRTQQWRPFTRRGDTDFGGRRAGYVTDRGVESEHGRTLLEHSAPQWLGQACDWIAASRDRFGPNDILRFIPPETDEGVEASSRHRMKQLLAVLVADGLLATDDLGREWLGRQ